MDLQGGEGPINYKTSYLSSLDCIGNEFQRILAPSGIPKKHMQDIIKVSSGVHFDNLFYFFVISKHTHFSDSDKD